MPSGEDEDKPYLDVNTQSIKEVSEYTGLNFCDCLELDCILFKKLLKDAYIYKLRKTENGRDYLEQCWILTQTNPDKQSLRKQFKR